MSLVSRSKRALPSISNQTAFHPTRTGRHSPFWMGGKGKHADNIKRTPTMPRYANWGWVGGSSITNQTESSRYYASWVGVYTFLTTFSLPRWYEAEPWRAVLPLPDTELLHPLSILTSPHPSKYGDRCLLSKIGPFLGKWHMVMLQK